LKKSLKITAILILCLCVVTIPIIVLNPSRNGTSSKWNYYVELEIFGASEEVNIKGISFTIETFLWRDFMPGPDVPPDGTLLIVIIQIYAQGEEDFPTSLKVERLWLIKGDVIVSTLSTDEYSINGNCLVMVFRDGPKWGPGICVDVVVKLVEINSNHHYLKAVNQYIYRTD
jgi:hypothetical protein